MGPGFSEVQDRTRELRPWFGDTRGLPRYHLPPILSLDVHRKVPNTKARVVAARGDLHARRPGHKPCPAVDADRAGFRNDGLVAELTERERVQKLRFRVVDATAMRVGQTVGESHSQRRQVTPAIALNRQSSHCMISRSSSESAIAPPPERCDIDPPAWSPHLAHAETLRGPSVPALPRGASPH